MEGAAKSETGLRPIVAAARRRSRDLARASFRLIIPALMREELNIDEARRRWAALKAPIRRQIAYTLFRRVLAFALALTAAQQILMASAFPFDRGWAFNTPQVFLVAMSKTVFFWPPVALMVWVVAFNLNLKSAIEQFVLYLAARKALGEIPLEQCALLPGSEKWQVRWRPHWKTYAPTCAIVALMIGFHLSKFAWMTARMMGADLYSVKASHASGVPVPLWPYQSNLNIWGITNSPAMMRYLIEKGADVNAPLGLNGGNHISRPLMAALSTCEVETARLLIERGADMRAGDFSGRTPMTIAVSNCAEAIELLLASGMDVNEQTRYGTPLLIAARYQWPYPMSLRGLTGGLAAGPIDRHGDAVKILIEKGADPNARDDAGRNALMVMSLEPQIDNDAEIPLKARGTRESRQRLRRSDKAVGTIGETLLNAGCDVNAVDNKGRTPLIYAVASERSNIVELLLKRGANIHAKDHNGESALDWAVKSGNDDAIMLLSSFSPAGGKKTSR
jgi:ankyrin repeat protein